MSLLRVLDLNLRNLLRMAMIPMENLLILMLKVLVLDPNLFILFNLISFILHPLSLYLLFYLPFVMIFCIAIYLLFF